MIDQYLLRQNPRTITRFNELGEDEKREIERQFDRHWAACARVGVEVDRLWLEETLSECAAGRFISVNV